MDVRTLLDMAGITANEVVEYQGGMFAARVNDLVITADDIIDGDNGDGLQATFHRHGGDVERATECFAKIKAMAENAERMARYMAQAQFADQLDKASTIGQMFPTA